MGDPLGHVAYRFLPSNQSETDVAVGQHKWYHFGAGEFTTHFRTCFSGDWDVYWGYGLLTHSHVSKQGMKCSQLSQAEARIARLRLSGMAVSQYDVLLAACFACQLLYLPFA